MRLILPFPPSVNTYWRHPTTGRLAGRHLISQKGRAYRAEISKLLSCLSFKKFTGPVSVDILVSMPDKRRRDIDNLLKSCLDSLTYAGVWDDDDQVNALSIKKLPEIKGFLVVEISTYQG